MMTVQPGARLSREMELRRRVMMHEAEKHAAKMGAFREKRHERIWTHAIEEAIKDNFTYLRALNAAKTIPVTLDEFLTSKDFFADQMDIWPALLPDLREANADVLAGEVPVHEVLLGGATGTGKTAMGHVTNAYQAYCMTCFNEPQRLFGLPPSTPIIFMFQSVSTTVTKRVIYGPLRTMFISMPYVQKHVSYDKNKESSLDLEGNIQLVPALASIQAMVGQAIAGAIVDEINFMSVVENSKQVPGSNGQGGYYDQAEVTYRNIARRRKSRFVTKGPSWGVLCISSSTRYKGDFLDRRIDEVEEHAEPNILVRRHKQYEMQPQYAEPGYPTFRFLVGTDAYPGRILTEEDVEGRSYPEGAAVENVPIDYLKDFRRDPEGSSRDVIGVASLSISPFISQRHKIIASILRTRDNGRQNWVVQSEVDLAVDGMPQWDEAVLKALPPEIKRRKWFAHIDLSLASDRCGIGISSVAEYTTRIVGEGDDAKIETVPHYEVGCSIAIKPSSMAQIDITAVRNFLMQLKSYYGINLYMVTYDGFQSSESVRAWRSAGVRSDNISLDRGTEGYVYFRTSLYDDRVDIPDDELLRNELIALEHDKKKDKVDHPPRGSKDVSDGVAGSIFALSKSREVRTMTGYDRGDALDRPKAQPRPAGTRPAGRDRPQAPPRRKAMDFVKPEQPSAAHDRVAAAQEAHDAWEREQAGLPPREPIAKPAYDIRSEYGD